MKTKQLKFSNIIVFILLLTPLMLHAQVTLMRVDQKDRGAMVYTVVYGSDNESARNTLVSKGYNKSDILTQEAIVKDEAPITAGNVVVVKCDALNYEGKTIRHLGIGISRNSLEEAEQRAVKNLAMYFWDWKKNKGYEVLERGKFNLTTLEAKSCVMVLAIYRKDALGNKKLVGTNIMPNKITDEDYRKMRAETRESTSTVEYELTRIFAEKGKMAVLKSTTVSDKNISVDKIMLVTAAPGEKYNMQIYPEGTVSKGSEAPKYVLYTETELKEEGFSIMSYVKGWLRKKADNTKPEEKGGNQQNKTNSASTGVRG